MVSELEYDLGGTIVWGRKWLGDFSPGKTQLVSFDCANTCVAIDEKMNGSNLNEKYSFKMRYHSLVNWIGVLTLSQLLKLPSRQLEPSFVI